MFDQVIIDKADPDLLTLLKVDRVPTLYYQGQKYVDEECTQLILALYQQLQQESQAPQPPQQGVNGSQAFTPWGMQPHSMPGMSGMQPHSMPNMPPQMPGMPPQMPGMLPMETFTDPNYSNPFQAMPINPAAGGMQQMPSMPGMMPNMPGMMPNMGGMVVGGGMGQQQRNPFEGIPTKISDNSVDVNFTQLQQLRQMEVPGSDQPPVRNNGGFQGFQGGGFQGGFNGGGFQGGYPMQGGMGGGMGMQGFNPMMGGAGGGFR